MGKYRINPGFFPAPPELIYVFAGDPAPAPLPGVAGEDLHSLAPQDKRPVNRLIDMPSRRSMHPDTHCLILTQASPISNKKGQFTLPLRFGVGRNGKFCGAGGDRTLYLL